MTCAITYNIGAEDVRDASKGFGKFDIVLKKTSYGPVTSAAEETVATTSVEAMISRGQMQRLAR